MPSAPVSYGNSKKWIAPKIQQKQKNDRLNLARSKICKGSPFWHLDFDLETHKREFGILMQTRLQETVPFSPLQAPPSIVSDMTTSSTITSSSTVTSSTVISSMVASSMNPTSTIASPTIASPIIDSPPTTFRPAFSGKTIEGPDFASNLSSVLCLPTIFTPNFELGKLHVAPWPSRSEMKYEGDDRILTDKLHGRFPGAPRVAGNETVNWQQTKVIVQYDLENYHTVPSEAAIMLKSHFIDDADHATDEEAIHMIGSELLEMLDPVDRF
jgi:hypothetical protein